MVSRQREGRGKPLAAKPLVSRVARVNLLSSDTLLHLTQTITKGFIWDIAEFAEIAKENVHNFTILRSNTSSANVAENSKYRQIFLRSLLQITLLAS